MNRLVVGLLWAVLLLSFNSASAGSRGYRIVFIDLTPTQEARQLFQSYRATKTPATVTHCWRERIGNWIDLAYVKTQPIKLSIEKIRLAARGDAPSGKPFARLMADYRDDEIEQGFDGAVFVTKTNGRFVFSGLGKDASFVTSAPVSGRSISALDQSLCNVAAAFDKSFVP